MEPFSAISSPMDDPGHYVYLNTSLSTFSNSDAVSEGEIAISRELAQSSYDLAHRDCASSHEIAISTSDTASELLNVESGVCSEIAKNGRDHP